MRVFAGFVLGALMTTATVGQVPSEVRQPREKISRSDDRFRVEVTPEMKRHSRIRNVLYFAGTAYGFAALAFVLFSGLSIRTQRLTARLTSKPFPAAMIYYALFGVMMMILTLPLDVYSSWIVPHQFDLSNQSLVEWIVEQLKGLGVSVLFGAPIVALALLGIRKLPRRWWLAIWCGAIPISIFIVIIAPVVVDPVFNDFQPLRDSVLRDRLSAQAERAGISGARIYQVDKSRQTKTMNAYVTGLGPTKRIVLWDTLLAKMTRDEIVVVMGHEMGHYVLHHVWKGLAGGLAVFFVILFLVQRTVEWGIARYGPRWGVSAAHEPVALPWILLVVGGFSFLLSPLFSGFSRMIEHDADIFALEQTHLNEAAATAFIKFAEDSKVEPQPHPFIEFWRYSHPPLAKRIDFALTYRPWESGEERKAKGNEE